MLKYIQHYIFYYFIIVNALALIFMGYDKYISDKKIKAARIPEKTLLILAAIGGAGGSLFAMAAFKHKTRHKNFRVIVPLFFVLWLFVCVYAFCALYLI